MSARSILFLVPDARDASVRFRVLPYVSRLERLGWSTEVRDLQAPLLARLQALRATARYDRAFVHRLLLTPVEALLLRSSACHYVYDFDDAIMFRDSTRRRRRSRQREKRLARTLRGAASVLAGNEYLASWARRLHSRVEVLPTMIDVADYPVRAEPDAGPGGTIGTIGTIGWIGTRSNLPYLRTVLPPIAALCRKRPGLRLRVVCDEPIDDAPGVPVENRRWSLADEADELGSFSVGIAPLVDDPWTRGKCGAKILQYFAAGRPVVCSPIGENESLVRDGENGFFATTAEEWERRLAELLDDPDLRQRFGAAGRRWVSEHRSIESGLERVLTSLD